MTEWVLVPREPTAEMVIRGAESLHDNGIRFETDDSEPQHDLAADTYRKMLDAAPAAPQQAEPVAQIGWADEFGNLFPMGAWKPAQRTHHDSHKTAWRPVFLHPPAAPQQADTCPTCGSDCNERDELEKAEREIERLRALPQQAEPVAWMKFGGSVIHTMLKRGRPELYPEHTIPLYLHPPAAEVQLLRDAVAKLSTIVRVPNAEHIADEHNAAVAFLRRALEGGE